jgi:hypothetical protein
MHIASFGLVRISAQYCKWGSMVVVVVAVVMLVVVVVFAACKYRLLDHLLYYLLKVPNQYA